MVRVRDYLASDEDAAALRSVPEGWLAVECLGWWWVSRADAVTGAEFDPLGPYSTAAEAVDAACRAETEVRG